MTIDELRARREELRKVIRAFWQRGSKHEEWEAGVKHDYAKLVDVHAQILAIETTDASLPQVRYTYQVCGWSSRHGYFRSKYKVCESLERARQVLEELAKDPNWRIPTLIVKCTNTRAGRAPMQPDFDTAADDDLGPAAYQEIVGRHMCGSEGYTWNELLAGSERYTY